MKRTLTLLTILTLTFSSFSIENAIMITKKTKKKTSETTVKNREGRGGYLSIHLHTNAELQLRASRSGSRHISCAGKGWCCAHYSGWLSSNKSQ